MTDREMDCKIAELVMGLVAHKVPALSLPNIDAPGVRFPSEDGVLFGIGDHAAYWYCGNENDIYVRTTEAGQFTVPPVPPFTTDPAADYAVLVKVRESWDTENQGVFCNALTDSWAMRTWIHGGPLAYLHTAYQPGDYSRAALAALNAHPSDPTT